MVVTLVPPAVGVTDNDEEKGKPALVAIGFSVPDQPPLTVITTELIFAPGKGRTTQLELFDIVQLLVVVVMFPLELC
jgi:hypothetical protein